MEKMTTILFALMLVGCACKPVIQYVKVPPIEPPIITRPDLETDYLKHSDNAGVVLQAHRITIKKLQQWGLELETALDAYRIKKETK